MLTPVLTPLSVALLATGFAGTESYLGPSLSLNFSENSYSMGSVGQQPVSYAATDLITFTRSTKAWEWDWQGNYSEVAAGVMRIAHDPLTKSASTTPQTLGTGSYTFAVTYQYTIGAAVRVSADASNWMVGRVTASTPDSVTIWVSGTPVGAGTYSAWTLIVRRGIRVEEQRANLLLHSAAVANAVWGKTAVTATSAASTPDGLPAETLVPIAGSGNHFYAQTPAFVGIGDNSNVTLSLRVKAAGYGHFQIQGKTKNNLFPAANVDLTAGTITLLNNSGSAQARISPRPGGWFHCSLTWNVLAGTEPLALFLASKPTAANSLSFAADGVSGALVSAHQLEIGASPSTYMPTGASQVIRAADVPVVNTLAPWFNAAEGTIVVKAISSPSQPAPISEAYAALRGASINDRIEIAKATAQINITGAVVVGGVAQANMHSVTLPPNTGFSAAMSYKANDFAFSLNGGAVATDNSGSVPVVTLLQIGSRSSANQCNGIIENITYHPRVTDTQQAST